MKRLFSILLTFLMVISVVAGTAANSSAACNNDAKRICDIVEQYAEECQKGCGNNCYSVKVCTPDCQDPQELCELLKSCGVSDSRCQTVSELLNRLGCGGSGSLTGQSCTDAQPAEPLPTEPAEPQQQMPTDAPEQTATEPAVTAPTQIPEQEPTQAPTQKPTQAPTQKPTQAPTQKPTQQPSQTPSQAPAETSDSILAYEREVARLVNAERAKNGLSALTLSEKLCNGARVKSQDMRNSGYFDHNSPNYGTPFEMMKSFGITYRTAGENIAMGYATPQAVVTGWMNSPGHRANILNASFKEIGVGYVASGNYWTQWFIG